MLWPKYRRAIGLAAVMMWLSALVIYEINPLALMGVENRTAGVEVFIAVTWGGTLCLMMVGLIALVSLVLGFQTESWEGKPRGNGPSC